MARQTIQAVVFDFDGTLIDASDAICTSFNMVLEHNELPVLPASTVKQMIGRPLRDMFADVKPGAADDWIEGCIEQYRAEFMPRSMAMSRPIAGLKEVIPDLAQSCSLAIATSRSVRGAQHILEGFGLIEYFQTIVGIETVKNSKPHPEPILLALKRLDVRSAHAAMVGDTPDDVLSARAAGVWAVGLSDDESRRVALKEAGADRLIKDLTELPEALRRTS